MNRREFLKQTGSAAGIYVAESVGLAKGQAISIIVDPSDPVAAAPSRWAVEQLLTTLHARGVSAQVHQHLSQAPADFCIISSGLRSAVSREVLKTANANLADTAESLRLVPGKASGRSVLLACGRDGRGLVYALLDLADRSENAADPVAALQFRSPMVESPANPISEREVKYYQTNTDGLIALSSGSVSVPVDRKRNPSNALLAEYVQ